MWDNMTDHISVSLHNPSHPIGRSTEAHYDMKRRRGFSSNSIFSMIIKCLCVRPHPDIDRPMSTWVRCLVFPCGMKPLRSQSRGTRPSTGSWRHACGRRCPWTLCSTVAEYAALMKWGRPWLDEWTTDITTSRANARKLFFFGDDDDDDFEVYNLFRFSETADYPILNRKNIASIRQ